MIKKLHFIFKKLLSDIVSRRFWRRNISVVNTILIASSTRRESPWIQQCSVGILLIWLKPSSSVSHHAPYSCTSEPFSLSSTFTLVLCLSQWTSRMKHVWMESFFGGIVNKEELYKPEDPVSLLQPSESTSNRLDLSVFLNLLLDPNVSNFFSIFVFF